MSAGALAGIAGAAAYAAEMELDRRLFRYDADDLLLLGRIASRNRTPARSAGLPLHLFNGAVVGGIYGLAFHEWLPGPPWARGVLFAMLENIALYPLALLEQDHPAIRDGQLASYRSATAFVQETLCHLVFGGVLGESTEVMLRSSG